MVDDSPILEIKDDKTASITFSVFLKNKDIRRFEAFKEYVKTRTYGNIKVIVENINDLFYEVEGKTILEFICDKISVFDYKFKNEIVNNLVFLKELIRTGHFELLDSLKEETLALEYENGMSVFDYLLENNLLTKAIIQKIWEDNNYVEKIKNKDVNLLTYLNGYLLTSTNIGNVSTLEYLFQNNLVNSEVISNVSNEVVYDLCVKYNRQDLLKYLTENVLSQEKNGKTILELLLDNNIYPELHGVFNSKVTEILLKHKLFKYFVDDYEGNLLHEVSEGKTMLDVLLDNGVTPTTTFYSKKESLEIFIKHGRFDKTTCFNLDILLTQYNLNDTYLDLILDQKVLGSDINLSSINQYSKDIRKRAMFYIVVARHGFINHIDRPNEGILTNNNGELLKELLSIDKDLTINTILQTSVKENIDVAILLKMNGIEQKDIKIDLHSMDIVEDYLEGFNKDFKEREISEEAKALLEEFRTIMLSDNLSDPKMVDAMITSYTYLISTNNEYGIRELMKLIEIKKGNKDFCIKYSKTGSFYRTSDSSINLENIGLNTLNHETGHALFHLLTNLTIPEEYEGIIHELSTNREVIKKVQDYSKKFREIREKVCLLVDEKYMKDYHISDEDMKSIEEFIGKKKEEQKEEYLKRGYDEETIDTILSGIYSKEEYIEQDRRIKREELIDAILRSEYGAFITIGDIIDSIFRGKFKSSELLGSDGKIIKPCYGHGIAYYNRGVDWSFDETMANFSAIVKSPDAVEILTYLKSIVGEKFINCIENYYRHEISLSTIDLSDEEVRIF